MNIKRIVIVSIFLFALFFLFGWLYHGVLLKESYTDPLRWRDESSMMKHFPWLIIGQVVNAIIFTLVYDQGFSSRGVAGGVCLGLLFGFLGISQSLIMYAIQPLSGTLILFWILEGFIVNVAAGIIAGAIYKRVGSGPATSI